MAVQDTIGNGVWNIESAKVFEKTSNFVHIYVISGGSSPALSGAYVPEANAPGLSGKCVKCPLHRDQWPLS